MEKSVHLVIVEEERNILDKLEETCQILGFRVTVVPKPYIDHGRVGPYVAGEIRNADAAVVASFFQESRMSKGEEVVASLHTHCPKLLIIGCGGDESHKKAMLKAGAKGFAVRGMRSGVKELFEVLVRELGKQNASSPSTTKITPDQQ